MPLQLLPLLYGAIGGFVRFFFAFLDANRTSKAVFDGVKFGESIFQGMVAAFAIVNGAPYIAPLLGATSEQLAVFTAPFLQLVVGGLGDVVLNNLFTIVKGKSLADLIKG